MPSSPSRPAAAEEVSDMEISDGDVLPRHAAEGIGGGAANRAAPGSAGEEDEEIYDDDGSSDDSDYSYYDDSDVSGWYYEYGSEEEEGAGGGRASGSVEEEAASADVGGGSEAEESPRAVATCCICMDPWASYGAHRICCIPCGHVYGRSCLERWLLRSGNTSAKIRAQSTSSSSCVHPHPHAISSNISQLEVRLERKWEEDLAAERLHTQALLAAQNQAFEVRMAAQQAYWENRFMGLYALHGTTPPEMSTPPPQAHGFNFLHPSVGSNNEPTGVFGPGQGQGTPMPPNGPSTSTSRHI